MKTLVKKPHYPVSAGLRDYLVRYNREINFPLHYQDLFYFHVSAPLVDKNGNDTLWQTVGYQSHEVTRLHDRVKEIYAILKSGGDRSALEHLYIDRIDYCDFGNSQPFRVRIVNRYNENQDYFYIKKADASRVYGLELEHLLSPHRMHYLTRGDTLIEEHVAGIPGDMFVRDWLHSPQVKIVRLAKELVKFNERSFIRLLGDMRSCNFVMDMTPDVEEVQIRIRAMDFDQQCFNERKNFYLPQFFKDNRELVLFCTQHLHPQTAMQYQREEQSLILRRMNLIVDRLRWLLTVMVGEELSFPEKVEQLRTELADHYQDARFEKARTMGEIVRCSLERLSNFHDPASRVHLDVDIPYGTEEIFE